MAFEAIQGVDDHPAAMKNWLLTRSDKLRHDGRPNWQPSKRGTEHPKVAMVLHATSPDSVILALQHADAMPIPFDLIITNASGVDLEQHSLDLCTNLREVRVLEVDRLGGSMLPLVLVVNAGLLEAYDLVLNLAKPSESLDGRVAESELLSSEHRTKNILGALAEDPSLGLIAETDGLRGAEAWGDSLGLTQHFLQRLELEFNPSDLRFAASGNYWIRSFLLNGLRALDLSRGDFESDTLGGSHSSAAALKRALGLLCQEAGFAQAELRALDTPAIAESWHRYLPQTVLKPEARVFPFYLPQFHAFPENNSWWGPGFSEWNNVAAAKPMFVGHRQPNLPSDLGFYDLNDPQIRRNQYSLANTSGIEGMMYYHYWFAGVPLMEMPVEELVKSEDQHSFCVMWANENWTRRWDGGSENILIAQDHAEVSPNGFIDAVRHLITDERYVRVEGKPLLAVYRILQLPKFEEVLLHWRARAIEFGLPGLHILSVDVGSQTEGLDGDGTAEGLDGILEFPPHNRRWEAANIAELQLDSRFSGHVLRYRSLVEEAEQQFTAGLQPHRYPGVLVNFDNTARRQTEPDLWIGSNPFTFRRWLRGAVLAVQERAPDERIVFINAWNEWAEGAILEPTQRFGRSYLHAVRSAVLSP